MIVHKAVLGERCPSYLKYNSTTTPISKLYVIVTGKVKLSSIVTGYCTLTIHSAGLFRSSSINNDLTTILFVVVT